jgi:hypothetical protein
MTDTRPSVPRPRPGPTKSRAQRRRAEKVVGRRLRLRTVLQVLLALLVAGGITTFAVVLVRDDSHPTHRATPSPSPTASGANFLDPNLVSMFLGGAASDLAAVTTYDYRSLDDALNNGLAVTTGPYRKAYRDALTGDIGQTATAQHVVHTFELLGIGIGEINARGTRAKVLAFGRQRIVDDTTGPNAAISPVTLCATIRRDGNRFRISDLVEGANAGLPPGGADLAVAAEAARSEVVNLLSYRRASFDADLQRALAGATSPLREQIQKNAADTQAAMTKGKYDLSGTVTALAVVRADADTVTMLIAADSSRLADGGTAPNVTQERYEVTVTRTTDSWAASRVSSVDGS